MVIISSANSQFWEFLISGGIFMLFIVMSCFVGIAVSIHRALSLRNASVLPVFLRKELTRCDQYFVQGKTSALYHALRQSNTAVGNIGEVALSPDFSSREEASQAAEVTAKKEMVKLEGGMGILEVVITIAPLLGLLGTVSGLVKVFATLGATEAGGAGDPTQIAAGIATALNTTIAGLVVAVIVVILHSYFTRKLDRTAAQLEVLINDVLHQFYKHGGPKLYAKELKDGDKNVGQAGEAANRTDSARIPQSRLPNQST